MRNEGLEVFKAIRERYDGEKRNPFNEGEYGHRYARAMASWAGVLAWSGFHYSAVDKTMKFGDVPGTFFWSNGYAFGTITNSIKDKKTNITIKVIEGKIELERFELKGKKPFLFTGKTVLGPGKTIRITL
jgi:non-lysosomal glucosylceramidase